LNTDRHDPDILIELFDALFERREHCVLRHAADEPLYLPAEAGRPATILFAHGFFASALHEIAHWCLAGRLRRRWLDYGYWYQPTGRDRAAQAAFQHAEARPQALEWQFHIAAGSTFVPSVDNPGRVDIDTDGFHAAIVAEAALLQRDGLPPRARIFAAALAERFADSEAPASTGGSRGHPS